MDEKQATPHGVLIEELLDSTVPKTEREHAGALEIKVLRESNDRKNDQIMAFARQWADLDTQITALKAENERLREDHKYACDVADNLRAEIKTLRNQAVANTEDAERYRWLRSFATWVNEDYESIHYRWNADEFESVDAAIDHARSEGSDAD